MRYEIYNAAPEFKDVDSKTGYVAGYFASFNNIDGGGDRILPGAFAKTLSERGAKILWLFNHDSFMPLGKLDKIQEDNYGLYYEGKITRTSYGRDVLKLIEDKAIYGNSIGYQTIKAKGTNESGSRIRNLQEIKLYEGSIVSFPMNEQAIITSLKEFSEEAQKNKIMEKIDQLDNVLRKGNLELDDTYENLVLWSTQLKNLLDTCLITQPEETTKSIDEPEQNSISEVEAEKENNEPNEQIDLSSLNEIKEALALQEIIQILKG